MKYFLLMLVSTMLLFHSCRGDKAENAEAQGGEVDTLVGVAPVQQQGGDTIEPPAAADGLFDDFMYNFMRNKTFQMKRVRFPLEIRVDGKCSHIERNLWKFDPIYVREDVYTMLFDNEKSMKSEKDTSVHHVVVEWVYLDKGRVKQYHFAKNNGQWMLTALDTHDIEKNVNKDFFEFYRHFASDESYQMKHIANPFEFKTYDSDNFQEIDGVLDVAQWPDFKPLMPKGRITNINYGQKYKDDGHRVLVITSPSAGMSCTLSFRKQRGVWNLIRMESI